jgi:shikimate kinase
LQLQRVVLWGFMASGKSVVARTLARRLGWECVDLDARIERRQGRAIADIFRDQGEPAFRALEVEVTRSVVHRDRMVLATGGGWITNPGVLELLPPGTLTVWLRVSQQVVLQRVRAATGGPVRPLLATPDPAATVRRLLEQREPLYRRADLTVDTDGRDVPSITRHIEAEVRRFLGPPAQQSFQKDDVEQA